MPVDVLAGTIDRCTKCGKDRGNAKCTMCLPCCKAAYPIRAEAPCRISR